ncbi:hypothetical protein [Brachybacterium sp. NPDC056505]
MTAPLPQLAPAEKYRAVADRFAATVRGTADWDAPTPVVGGGRATSSTTW